MKRLIKLYRLIKSLFIHRQGGSLEGWLVMKLVAEEEMRGKVRKMNQRAEVICSDCKKPFLANQYMGKINAKMCYACKAKNGMIGLIKL